MGILTISCQLKSIFGVERRTNLKNFFIKNRKALLIVLVVIIVSLIGVPLAIQLLINLDTSAKGSDDGWLGFWGGYLGSIIGVLGALLVFQLQLKDENQARKEEKTDNTFFNLLNLHNEQKVELLKINSFNMILETIEEELLNELTKEAVPYFYEKKDIILKIINSMLKSYCEYMELEEKKLEPGDRFFERWQRIKSGEKFSDNYTSNERADIYTKLQNAKRIQEELEELSTSIEIEYISQFKNNIFNNDILYILNRLDEISIWNTSEKTRQSLKHFENDIRRFNQQKFDLLSDSGRKKAIEIALNKYLSDIGGFLRLFHRIIKYLNENTKEDSSKKNYIGFLRATLNESEILVIYYNCVYTDKGRGLLKQLSETTFFGEETDFIDSDTPPFVGKDRLYFKNDFEIMSDLKQYSIK